MTTENYNCENTVSEFIDEIKNDEKKINPNERGNTIEAKGNIKDLYLFLTDIKNDEILGKLDYIFNTGANDVYEVTTTSNTKVYLPAIKQVIKKVDIKSRKIYVEIMEGLI